MTRVSLAYQISGDPRAPFGPEATRAFEVGPSYTTGTPDVSVGLVYEKFKAFEVFGE